MFVKNRLSSTLLSLVQGLDVYRLRLHFKIVAQRLGMKNVRHLPESIQQSREKGLVHLRAYGQRGIFPRNETHPHFRPCFIDSENRECAVAHLLIQTGEYLFAQHIARTTNLAFVREMDTSALEVWVSGAGFTNQELQMIQPAYPPSPDEMTLIRLMYLGVQLSGMVALLGLAGFFYLIWESVKSIWKKPDQDHPSTLEIPFPKSKISFIWQNKFPFLFLSSGIGILGFGVYLRIFPHFMGYTMWSDFQDPMFLSIFADFVMKLLWVGMIQVIIAWAYWSFMRSQNQQKTRFFLKVNRYAKLVIVGVGIIWIGMNYLALSEIYHPLVKYDMMLLRTLVGYCLQNPGGWCP